MTSADVERLAELAYAAAESEPARSAKRRAAAHLYVSLTIPPARFLSSARRAIASFGAPATQAAALELLTRLAAQQAARHTPLSATACGYVH